ncbi:MAG: GntR family transcriptional regulator [Acidobacteria bacterium]|nr:GntR family transcriptional regulator [Acidobacteriota bacterium]
MIPFRVELVPGEPVYEQVVFAAKKAILAGRLQPGDAFPSVRLLAKAVKIHANTAQKVIAELVGEGLLEVRPGIGTVVTAGATISKRERGKLLHREVESLVVEALRLGMQREELLSAVEAGWHSLSNQVEV